MTNSLRMVGRRIVRSAAALTAAAALAGIAGTVSAQPFDPAQPDVIEWGSAGFTDLAVLSVAGRDGGPGDCDFVCVDSDFTVFNIPGSFEEVFPKGGTPQIVDVTLVVTFEKLDAECDDTPIEHGGGSPHNDEIVYRLTSPAGTTVTAIDSDEGTPWDNDPYRGIVTFSLNDSNSPLPSGAMPPGGSFAPEQPFSAFNGQNPLGNWQLRVEDTVGADALLHFGHELIITAVTNGVESQVALGGKSLPPGETCTCDNLKEVASVYESGAAATSLSTMDKKNGKITEINLVDPGADANGRVFGIAEFILSDGNFFEAQVTGKAKFVEKASIVQSPAEFPVKGEFVEFVPFAPSSIERKLNHKVTVKANSKQAKANLKLSDKSVRTDYFGAPLVFSGKLNTNIKKLAKGKSDVVVTGIIDHRSDFLISASSITATPDLNRWNGDAMLCTPFNMGLGAKGGTPPVFNDLCFGIPPCDAPFLPGGFTKLNTKWYDASKNKPAGNYKITQSNSFEGASYRANSSGYMLSNAADAQLVADGDISLSDLQYRSRNFTFRTPAANTKVKTSYSSDALLMRFPGGIDD